MNLEEKTYVEQQVANRSKQLQCLMYFGFS